jgi:NTE family protein
MGFDRKFQAGAAPTAAAPVGLVLPGGGARAAYQVGVLRALADLLPTRATNPFPVVTGTSAGAVNATAIAVHADRFRVAVGNLERVWRNFQVGQVFRADTVSMLRSGLHWALAMMSGGWLLPPPRSLFDNSPLRELLRAQFDFDGVRRAILAGHLDALAICAAGYVSTRSVSFYQAKPGREPWNRMRRAGQPVALSLDHLMASVAVPFLFPPVLLGDEYYGDGAMREANPFSAAIHLGAHRLLVIGTRNDTLPMSPVPPLCPTFGQIFGYMLDSLFTDGLYSDLERLTQLNQIVERVGPITIGSGTGSSAGSPGPPVQLRHIDMLVLLPSRDLSEIARHHVESLPRTLRVLLRTLGAMNTGGGQLMSYLLFQDTYTRELIALGYQDAMRRSADLLAFMGGQAVTSTGSTGIMRRLASGEEKRAQTQQ